MYNPASRVAEEFIDHQEILDTLKYAEENKCLCFNHYLDFYKNSSIII